MNTQINLTAVELTVLYATLVDSLDVTDIDGKKFAFGRDARQVISRDLWTKLEKVNFKLEIGNNR